MDCDRYKDLQKKFRHFQIADNGKYNQVGAPGTKAIGIVAAVCVGPGTAVVATMRGRAATRPWRSQTEMPHAHV